MASNDDFDAVKARYFPESVFADPQDLVTRAGLTIGQRLSAAVAWRRKIAKRLETRPRSLLRHASRARAREVQLLADIDNAIDALLDELQGMSKSN